MAIGTGGAESADAVGFGDGRSWEEVATAQAELIARLEQRLVRLEAAVGSAVEPSGWVSSGSVPPVPWRSTIPAPSPTASGHGDAAAGMSSPDGTPTPVVARRALLSRGAVVAGAAVAGTAFAVASADPAAAASGSFDGNPAVSASANPVTATAIKAISTTGIAVHGTVTSGDAVRGEATSGIGVVGEVTSGTGVRGSTNGGIGVIGESGAGTGVRGVASDAAGLGVRGVSPGTGVSAESTAPSGATAIGVKAVVASSDGYAVDARSNAAHGAGTAVRATSVSDAGIAVLGVASATTGGTVGVEGRVASDAGSAVVGNATAGTGSANGVVGTTASPGGYGVWGQSTGATGVLGQDSATSGPSVGVAGSTASTGGVGVQGEAQAAGGVGVLGTGDATAGTGVSGAGATALLGFSSRTHLRLAGSPPPPLTAGMVRQAGEIVLDANRDLWLCIAGGNPGTWRRLGGAATAGAFVLLTAPVRVYDSRPGEPPAVGTKSPLAAGVARSVDLTANSSGVPAGATAAMVSIIATNNAVPGFVTVYKDGIPYPGTSNLDFEGHASVAVTTITALSAVGRCAVRSNVSTDVVVDVLGYYQ